MDRIHTLMDIARANAGDEIHLDYGCFCSSGAYADSGHPYRILHPNAHATCDGGLSYRGSSGAEAGCWGRHQARAHSGEGANG